MNALVMYLWFAAAIVGAATLLALVGIVLLFCAEQFAVIAGSMPELDACDGLAAFYLRPEVSTDGR